jgi:hypothetical protein
MRSDALSTEIESSTLRICIDVDDMERDQPAPA